MKARRLAGMIVIVGLTVGSCGGSNYSEDEVDALVEQAVAEALATTSTTAPNPLQSSTTTEISTTTTPPTTTTTLPSALPADRCDDFEIGTEAISPGGFKLVCTKAGPYGAWPNDFARWWDSGEENTLEADPTRGEREALYVARIRFLSEGRPRNWVDELKDNEIASRGWATCSLLEQTEYEMGEIPEDTVFLQWQAVVISLEAHGWDDMWTAGEMVSFAMLEATDRLCPRYRPYGGCMTQMVLNFYTGADASCGLSSSQ